LPPAAGAGAYSAEQALAGVFEARPDGNTDLSMCAADEIMPHRISRERHVMTLGRRQANFGEPRMLPVILCSAAGDLCDRLASTSKMCAVTVRVRSMGVFLLEVALSIWRVIRANFTRGMGILAGGRSLTRRARMVQQSGSRTNQCR